MSFFVPLHFIFPRRTLKRVIVHIVHRECREMLRPTGGGDTTFALKKKKKRKKDAVVFLFVLSGVRGSLRSQRRTEGEKEVWMGKKKGMVDWVGLK